MIDDIDIKIAEKVCRHVVENKYLYDKEEYKWLKEICNHFNNNKDSSDDEDDEDVPPMCDFAANEIMMTPENDLMSLKNKMKQFTNECMYEKAYEISNKIIELEPTALAYANRAELSFMNGNIKNTITDCKKALSVHPECAKALKTQAMVHINQKEWDFAIMNLQKAQNIDFCEETEKILKCAKEKKSETRRNSNTPKDVLNSPDLMKAAQKMMENPEVMRSAQQMMQNPEMMSQLMSVMGQMNK